MRNIINMRKSAFMAASVAALIAGGISAAHAAASHTVPAPFNAMPCSLLDGNGGVQTSPDIKFTATESERGNATFQCKGNVPPANSGDAVNWDANSAGPLFGMSSVPCMVPVADAATGWPVTPTNHWEETVSASGEATMTCHLP